MSSIRTFKTFLAIADTGSFTAAAQRVALTPAAVGAQMKSLEEDMGRPLFARENRGAVMTPAGVSLLPRARRLVADYEEMVRARDDNVQVAGSVVVGSITSAVGLLAASVVELKALHPALDVTLIHGRQADLRDRVLAGDVDAAIFVESPRREEPNTEWQHLYTEPLMLVCSSQLASPQSDAARLLRTQPFIRFDHTGSTGPKIEQILRRNRIQPREILEMNSVTAIVELVRQNIGISVVPVLRGFDWDKDRALCLLPVPGRRFERRIGMLRNLRRAHITSVLQRHLFGRLGDN